MKCLLGNSCIHKGAKFIGTNPDLNLPSERGLLPGAGSLVKMIEAATRVHQPLLGNLRRLLRKSSRKNGHPKEDLLMVGDNYLTDIRTGIDNVSTVCLLQQALQN